MKVVLAGAFGHLGSDVLRELVKRGHDVVAFGRTVRKPADCADGYQAIAADVLRPESLKGICDGADAVISTIGLTTASDTLTCYDVDLQGNLNLLEEAKRAGVAHFAYVSVLKADGNPAVPMLDAKAQFEAELKDSGLNWVIFRPGGYFYDIAKVFMPMVEKGQVTLLGNKQVHANLVDTPDLARFIADHLCDCGKTYDVGGKETYSYEEIAKLFFYAAGKEPVVKRVPAWLFDVLAAVSKARKDGREAAIRFSKWTLTEEMVANTVVGDTSLVDYIVKCFEEAKTGKLLLDDAKRSFRLTEVDVGEYAVITSKGMRFDVRVFDAEGAGRLFLMDMKAFGGLMKMETATFTPTQLDGPIISADIALAFGRSTLVLELYDTTASHPDFRVLGEVKERYASLPSYEPDDQPYYRILLPESAHKKGRGIEEAVRSMAEEYSSGYFACLQACPAVDAAEKKARNAEFAEKLFNNGGPAVNQFKKMIGEENTREFLLKYMFCSL